MASGHGYPGFDREHRFSSTTVVVCLVLKTCAVSCLHRGMGVAFIPEEGLPPLWICVDKVFAEVPLRIDYM